MMGMAALLPLGCIAGAALLSTLAAYRTIDQERLQYTARAVAAAVDARLGSYLASLEMLGVSRALDDPPDFEDFERRARLAAEALGGEVVLIGPPPEFRMLAHTRRQPDRPLPRAVHPEGEDALEAVFQSGGARISDLFTGAVTGRPTLAIIVPVERPGQSRRALALAISPSSFSSLLTEQDLPAGTFAAIADSDFRIIAHSLDRDGRATGMRAPEWTAAAVGDQSRTVVVGPGWSGQDNVYAVERLALAPGWTVTVAEPQAVQQAQAWAAVGWLLAGGAALALGMLVLIWMIRWEAVRDGRREADALRAGRAQVERLLGGLPAVIFLRDMAADGTSQLLYRGGDLEAVMGWPNAELAARQDFDDLLPEDEVSLGQLGPQLLRDGRLSHEWHMRQPDGSLRTLHTLAHVLARRPNGGAEVVGYTVDITARREAEARALNATRLASVGEMAAGLAHEIRQPLQAISFAAELAELALRNDDAEGVRKRLDMVMQEVKRTSDMIEGVRRFARGGDGTAEAELVSLADRVQAALKLTRSALRAAMVRVEVELGQPVPMVRAHPVLLEQVLINLLLNARDAMAARPPDAPRRIRIAAEPRAENVVQLTVSDTGGGIAPEVMARIFQPFVTTKEPDKGTGLGLSICRGLIRSMGGRIEAWNDGEGAVFTIILPSAPCGADPPAAQPSP